MAEINLLKAAFTGKLGETYGAKWKGKPVIRAVPFSKAPPTADQTACVRAFEALNRFSSALSRLGFNYLGLSSKNLHKHNAVAKFLKPMIKNHKFEPCNITEIIHPGHSFFINSFALNQALNTASVDIELSPGFVPANDQRVFLIVFNNLGTVFLSRLFIPQNFNVTFRISFSNEQVFFCLAFLSSPSKKGYNLDNLVMQEGFDTQYSI